ncbi:hypothetical protein HYC85_025947 [Camellia sinensis]|uniref:Sm domain-containing protein n=3 Tax=Camellia TaxID=4441 RepID=A0A7J7G5D3_CAMSI|nr:hypothetical protein HYC85_025947 [Camellia sinensis]
MEHNLKKFILKRVAVNAPVFHIIILGASHPVRLGFCIGRQKPRLPRGFKEVRVERERREEGIAMSRSLGIPVKLLHEAAGHVVTVELKSGELYRGSMVECEDNWNCQLENITFTAKDGKVSQLEHVFIRGSKVRFMVIPDMLKNAPMFKRLESRIKGKGSAIGVGRGRAVAMRARAQAAGRGAPPGRGAVPSIRRLIENPRGSLVEIIERNRLRSYSIKIDLGGVLGNAGFATELCLLQKALRMRLTMVARDCFFYRSIAVSLESWLDEKHSRANVIASKWGMGLYL